MEDLEKQGLLVKVEPHSHNVGTHDRCGTTVEPMVKQQWFVKMDELIKPAVEAVKNGDIQLLPKRMEKTYLTGLTISVTGVFPVSSGGDTAFRLITARTAVRWW